jgi:hypothetical protein
MSKMEQTYWDCKVYSYDETNSNCCTYIRYSLFSHQFWIPVFASANVSAFRAGLSALPAVVCKVMLATYSSMQRVKRLTPPSTGMMRPVIQPASLLARNRMATDNLISLVTDN